MSVGTVKVSRPKRKDPWYFPPFIIGHLTTIKHFFANLFGKKRVATIEYPDVRRQYSGNFRGRHWLRTREDGSVACVACFMCSTHCPADCIRIIAGENPNLPQEKYPVVFEIDLLRCVYCGYCVDACPCNVIYMTRDDELATFTRNDGILTLEDLIQTPEHVKDNPMGYKPWKETFPIWKGINRMKY